MDSRLLPAAKEAMARAYARYSEFQVGAAILAENDRIYAGCNVENAAYPLGSCAEAGAIAAMVQDGARRIREILIIGGRRGDVTATCPPCGGCRQRILEFAEKDTRIHLIDGGGACTSYSCAELLPHSFDPGHVK